MENIREQMEKLEISSEAINEVLFKRTGIQGSFPAV